MSAAGLTFRLIIGLAALGMIASALILLGEAGSNMLRAARAMVAHDHAQSAISLVMKTIDECLFAIIIILLGGKVFATFVVSDHTFQSPLIPQWFRPSDLSALKSTFCQTILVYLIVDFATDMATAESKLDPGYLVLPTAILLIAGALKLMPHGDEATGHHRRTTPGS